MTSTKTRSATLAASRCTFVVALVLAALALPGTSLAAPPSNDNFADATVVPGLPFSDTVNIVEATTEPGEPSQSWGQSRTVWWSFTPSADTLVRVRPRGCCAFLFVFRADAPGFTGLARLDSSGSNPLGTTYPLTGGTTYYFQSGDSYPYGWETATTLPLEEVVPPANDDFAGAVPFSSVPFSHSVDATAATREPDEPTACGGSAGPTVWYAFTPTTSGSYGWFGTSSVSVYTGSSLDELTSVACSDWPGLFFYAEAGVTYYLQSTNAGVSLDIVPAPDPAWCYSPEDPSVQQEVFFTHGCGYWDPTITEYRWDFGDGTTGHDNGMSHRFARDGNYAVTLTVDARGGRTATHTRIVQVRTHDVSIRWSSAPARGRIGRTVPIEVGIGNSRYAETVQVDFYRSTPNGFDLVASVTKAVPVLHAKKTVPFSFEYTLTEADLAIGKVNFQVIATIQGARDAFGSDNVVITAPTIVTR
jgi:hypothetical protein